MDAAAVRRKGPEEAAHKPGPASLVWQVDAAVVRRVMTDDEEVRDPDKAAWLLVLNLERAFYTAQACRIALLACPPAEHALRSRPPLTPRRAAPLASACALRRPPLTPRALRHRSQFEEGVLGADAFAILETFMANTGASAQQTATSGLGQVYDKNFYAMER